MSYLSCPHCRLTVSESAVRSPFQYCPRCMLRHQAQRAMHPSAPPNRRFTRNPADLDRITEAKTSVNGRLPATG